MASTSKSNMSHHRSQRSRAFQGHYTRSPLWNVWQDPWNTEFFTPRIMDQHFGMTVPDVELEAPVPYADSYVRPRKHEPKEIESGMSQVTLAEGEFKVNLDVSHFRPEEIEVKTLDNRIVVHGKHEERQDEHGFITREFTRGYVVPKGVDPSTVKSTLSADSMLTIFAPKKIIENPKERTIPIECMPGVPALK